MSLWVGASLLVACGGVVPSSAHENDAGPTRERDAALTHDAGPETAGDALVRVQCVTPLDCPASQNGCTAAVCRESICTTEPAPPGMACVVQGAVCDGHGNCVDCLVSSDCPGGLSCSLSHTCTSSMCADGMKDGSETDVDCGGGTCSACGLGQTCDRDSDCTSTACSAVTMRCVSSRCVDGKQDGAETDIDCGGGTCAPCGDGLHCKRAADCSSGFCDEASGVCVGASCDDGSKDGSETDVDCGGGECPACSVGKGCAAGTDCASGACDAMGMCGPGECTDGIKDGSETDVDCGGGACPACVLGSRCNFDADCASNGCNPATHLCITPTCSDGFRDGNETGVDCGGGTCFPCGQGESCNVNADCLVDDCYYVCLPPSCSDGVKDGSETDVDCGGGCRPCPLGDTCDSELDCLSHACDALTLVCIADQCADHALDGNETDVDCGGSNMCARCPAGDRCISNADCQMGLTCNTGSPHLCT